MATILAIADSIVAELNAGSFSQPIAAERLYQPRFELPDMVTLHVSVVPRSLSSQSLDRGRDAFSYQIDVAVQQKVDAEGTQLDTLMGLVEELADHFRTQPLPSYPGARCTEVRNDPVYAPEHLGELQQFTSVITLTFKVWR